MLSVPTGSEAVVRVAAPDPFRLPVPSELVPLKKVTVPVGTVVAPEGGVTTAVSVTLLPDAMLALLDVSMVAETSGAGGVTVVLASALVFAASTLPTLSVPML